MSNSSHHRFQTLKKFTNSHCKCYCC